MEHAYSPDGSDVLCRQIFPINVKAAAGSLVTLVSWLCSWIISYSFNFMFDWSSSGSPFSILRPHKSTCNSTAFWQCYSIFAGAFFIFAGISCLTVVFVAKFVPETKGRVLEELQASLSNAIQWEFCPPCHSHPEACGTSKTIKLARITGIAYWFSRKRFASKAVKGKNLHLGFLGCKRPSPDHFFSTAFVNVSSADDEGKLLYCNTVLLLMFGLCTRNSRKWKSEFSSQ